MPRVPRRPMDTVLNAPELCALVWGIAAGPAPVDVPIAQISTDVDAFCINSPDIHCTPIRTCAYCVRPSRDSQWFTNY